MLGFERKSEPSIGPKDIRRFLPSESWRVVSVNLVLPLLVTLQVGSMFFFARGSYFFADDWLNFAIALRTPFNWAYLSKGDFGHFVPLHRAVNYAVAHLFPANYNLCLAFGLLIFAGTLLYMYRILRLLCDGSRGQVLVLLFLYGFSAIYASVFQWWAALLNLIPSAFFSLVCIDGFLRFKLLRSRLHLALSICSMCVGFLFWEKPVLLPIYLVLLSALVLQNTTTVTTMMRTLVREWWVWTLYLIPCAIYVWIYYVHQYYDQAVIRPTLGQMVVYLVRAWGEFGLAYVNLAIYADRSPSHLLLQALSGIFLLGLIGASLVLNGNTWKSWLFFLLSFLVNMTVIGWARLGLFGVSIAGDVRYTFENSFLFTMTLGMAFLPCSRFLRARNTEIQVAGHHWRPLGTGRMQKHMRYIATGVFCGAHLVLFLSSAAALNSKSDGRTNKEYFDNFRHDLAALNDKESPVSFYDLRVPFVVVPEAFQPFNRYSFVLPQVASHIVFNRPKLEQHYVGNDGHIFSAVVVPSARFDLNRGPTNLRVTGGVITATDGEICLTAGTNVSEMAVDFPLDKSLTRDYYFLQLAYRSASPIDVSFALLPIESNEYIDATAEFEHTRLSPNETLYVRNLRFSTIRGVRVNIAPATTLCISRLEVGNPVRSK